MKKKMKSKRFIIVTLISLFLLLGTIWQSIMVDIERETYTPIGKYADLGAYQGHYYSQGEGDVAFVFITGSGTPCAYTDFYALQNMLTDVGQTITFDHAGSGWSSSTKTARTIENLVNELSILIDTVAPGKSIVLLCHSLGSLEAIGYAQMYSERVVGIVFLDSGSPEFYSTDSELLAKTVNRGSAFVRTVAINRLLGEFGLFLPIYGENIRNRQLPEEVKNLDKAMYYQFAGNSSSLDTISLINENGMKVLGESLLGNLPILVLSSDSGDEWNEVQKQLASWSENSKQIIIRDSEHYLYWSNYNEVEEYIAAFVDENIK